MLGYYQQEEAAVELAEEVRLNFTRYAGVTSDPTWNNLDADPRNLLDLNGFTDVYGTPVAYGLTIVTPTNEHFYEGPGSTGNESGVWPDAVQLRSWGSNGANWSYKIIGLEPGSEYQLDFFASQYSYHSDSQNININGDSYTMTGLHSNQDQLISYQVFANGSGEILIELSPVGNLAVIGAMSIKQLN